MINNELLEYIKHQLNNKVSREIITSNLKLTGWLDADVNEAFLALPPVIPQAPVPVSPVTPTVAPGFVQPQIQPQSSYVAQIQPLQQPANSISKTISVESSTKGKGKKIFLVIIFLIILIGGGFYFYKTKKINQSILSIFNLIKNSTNKNLNISDVKDNTKVENQVVPVAESPFLPIVGDYEVKILDFPTNNHFLVGQKITIKILVGKNINSLASFGVASSLETIPNIKQYKKSSDGTFSIEYTIPSDFPFLGRNFFFVKGEWIDFNNLDNIKTPSKEDLINNTQYIPIIVDSIRQPISLETDKLLTIKIGGTFINGKQLLISPSALAAYSKDEGVFISDNSIAEFIIKDESVAQIEEVDSSKLEGVLPLEKVLNIKGIKVGTTKLTISYKNLSTTVDIKVTK